MKIYDHTVQTVTRKHAFKVKMNGKEWELYTESVNGSVPGTIRNAIKTSTLNYFDEISLERQEEVLESIRALIASQQF